MQKTFGLKGAYTGNRPDAKPENYGNRAIPLDYFLEVLAERIAEHNSRQGRLSPTARGRSFDETFAESYATAPIRKATEDQRRLWLMGQEVGKLNKNSGQFQLFGNFYHSNWMSERAGDRVVARFGPEDLHSGVHIYEVSGSYLGFAECRQKVGFFDVTGAREEARRKQRIKSAEKAVLKAHRPLSIEDIVADMDARAPDLPEPLDSKVVSPMFRRHPTRGASSIPSALTPENPELDAAHEALVIDMAGRAKTPNAPPTDSSFRLGATSDDRFDQAQRILARSEAGTSIGRAEADWCAKYVESGEYEGLLAMFESFNTDGAVSPQ